ncbi:phage holin family protein [Helcococcus ovis]|uniref:phage holin family protein n=1 Tax=Helcococcus TaxID=31983 RepID=UPI00106F5865|nr:phage holin family protein [Helcococcus ovis]TFF68368.1 holin [Helcococcus ovis]WNZ00877.1 phage holin family protein [Helcococcus ovis]
MFEYLRHLIATEDNKVIFILTLIAIAMIIDFVSGTIAAKINPDIKFESKKGINGILRKLISIIVMIFFIPLSVIIPNAVGATLVYVLYLGYLLMELKSILENLQKMGINITLFNNFIKEIENNKQ